MNSPLDEISLAELLFHRNNHNDIMEQEMELTQINNDLPSFNNINNDSNYGFLPKIISMLNEPNQSRHLLTLPLPFEMTG